MNADNEDTTPLTTSPESKPLLDEDAPTPQSTLLSRANLQDLTVEELEQRITDLRAMRLSAVTMKSRLQREAEGREVKETEQDKATRASILAQIE